MSKKGEAVWAAAQEIKMQEHLKRTAECNAKGEQKRMKNKAVDRFDRERMRAIDAYKA